MWDAITGIGEELGYKVYDWIHSAYEWGRDLIQNFFDGIKEKWNEHKKFWEGFGEYVYDYLHHSTPEKGPLKDDDKWGGDLMDNFIGGAEAKEKELARTFAGIAQTAADALEVDAHGVSFEGAIKAAQDAQRGIEAAETIIDVQFDTSAIASAVEQIKKTPIELEATLDTDAIQSAIKSITVGANVDINPINEAIQSLNFEPAVNAEVLTSAVGQEAATVNPATTPAEYAQTTNVSFAGAEIKIVVEGADRNGADIADEIADRLAFMDNLANLKAGKVAL